MYKSKLFKSLTLLSIFLTVISCKTPAIVSSTSNQVIPETYSNNKDTTNMSNIPYKKIFMDNNLQDLIAIAINNNQELMITLQEIEIAKNDIQFRKGRLLPTVNIGAGAGVEKVGRFTSQGAGDFATQSVEEFPDPLTDFKIAAYANWEVDVWKKLRNSKKAAVTRYLSTIEGKNFVVTSLVSEVADNYYELLALDSQLEFVRQNIKLQTSALEIVKIQKEAARATELAVQKFQAEVLASQNLEFETLQRINETENRINFLLGRFPQEIKRDKTEFLSLQPANVNSGIPSQLLANRPDIKQAELELAAAKLDVKVARAEFYPSLDISAGFGTQAFKTAYLTQFPESMLYSLVGDIAGPLINRNAIKAEFKSANARQLQALYNYERTILNAYLEVATQLSRITNLDKSYDLKSKQVESLNKSIDISNDLFKSARVDYFEVLMTQRDALETKLELVDVKKELLNSRVHIYKQLGGGWK